jgi:hypothetical protein
MRGPTAAFVEGYLRGEVLDEDVVDARLQAMADDPEVMATILEGARAIDDAIGERAVFHTGRLVRMYSASAA